MKATMELIQKAVSKSKELQLSEDKLHVARMEPLSEQDDSAGTQLC